MEQTVQMKSCGLLHLGGVVGWDFWWIVGERESQQYVAWPISNFRDGLLMIFHSDKRWVKLRCFGTVEIALCE
jgi:hypothetical protein